MKSSNKNKSVQEKKIHPEVKVIIAGILFCLLGILSILAFMGQAGLVGGYLDKVLAALFGRLKQIFPAVLFLWGYMLIFPSIKKQYVRLIGVMTTFLVWMSFLSLYVRTEEGSMNFKANLAGQGGGVVGFGLASVLDELFGMVGSSFILFALLLVGVLLIINQPIFSSAWWAVMIGKSSDNEDQDGVDAVSSGNLTSHFKDMFNREKVLEEGKNDRELKINTGSNMSDQYSQSHLRDEYEKFAQRSVPVSADRSYVFPPLSLLESPKVKDAPKSGDLRKSADIIKATLLNFGIEVEMGEVDIGPTVTRFLLRPSNGVKLSSIITLQNDIALALAAKAIRIEAPVPGKSYVGIEIPNEKRELVRLRQILESEVFVNTDMVLPIVLGKDVVNHPIVAGLEKMPHMLIAGATGAGKSMGLNSMILSLLYRHSPDTLRFIFVDPKRVELSSYNGIPHLLTPEAISDPGKALNALLWCVGEMERRYDVISKAGSRNIESYNTKIYKGELKEDELHTRLPFIVVVIDELADLMSTHKKEVEGSIVRIAQMARAVGMHLVLATQRPSIDVITGLIKANMPARASFQVASQIDSRTILDMMGAEKLLGAGDMLFLGGDLAKPRRIQGPFVSEKEVNDVVEFLKKNSSGYSTMNEIISSDIPDKLKGRNGFYGSGARDEMFEQAKELVIREGKASASLLQRRMGVGFPKAGRLIDELEQAGIIGSENGSKPREILSQGEIYDESQFFD
jgi:S-DNA-T family DNA segregation ATPase FtsK/SpoIIIE